MRRFRTACLVAALAALVAAPSPTAAAQEVACLQGRLSVVGARGQAIEGAVLTFVGVGFRHRFEVRTDERGRFGRLGVRSGVYKVTIEREGYAAVDVLGVHVRPSDRLWLPFEMIPIDEAPFKRHTVHYRRPVVNTQDSAIVVRL